MPVDPGRLGGGPLLGLRSWRACRELGVRSCGCGLGPGPDVLLRLKGSPPSAALRAQWPSSATGRRARRRPMSSASLAAQASSSSARAGGVAPRPRGRPGPSSAVLPAPASERTGAVGRTWSSQALNSVAPTAAHGDPEDAPDGARDLGADEHRREHQDGIEADRRAKHPGRDDVLDDQQARHQQMVTGTMAFGANTRVVANSGSQDTSWPK